MDAGSAVGATPPAAARSRLPTAGLSTSSLQDPVGSPFPLVRQNRGMTNPVVAVLGTGTMGAGMVRSLRRAEIPVRAWNRDMSKARALTDSGAEVFDSPDEAAKGADVVLTMLMDADSAIEVIRRAAPAEGTIWMQCSTVGVDGVEATITTAHELGLVLVDCPVQGTRVPAETGNLVLLASGPEECRERLAPVFDAVGAKTLWLGEAGAGSRLKLATNAWVLTLTSGVAQSIALTRALGIDPQDFFTAIEGGPLDNAYARVKGANMIDDDYPVNFALPGALKDARLIRAALQSSGIADRLIAAVVETLEVATGQVADPNAVDMGALITGLTPRQR
jgi:3-hydroxyisobutyrate dehydrogenase